MVDLALPGCTPEPLMNYLKALGVFRLVAEQADPQARLSWLGGIARLQSKLDRDGLMEFFTNEYRPTPILAPWNGGSGFYGGGSEPLNAVADSDSSRLESYRSAIECIRTFVPNAKPKDEEKDSLLARCRQDLSGRAPAGRRPHGAVVSRRSAQWRIAGLDRADGTESAHTER